VLHVGPKADGDRHKGQRQVFAFFQAVQPADEQGGFAPSRRGGQQEIGECVHQPAIEYAQGLAPSAKGDGVRVCAQVFGQEVLDALVVVLGEEIDVLDDGVAARQGWGLEA
jgi:hypothetical protein